MSSTTASSEASWKVLWASRVVSGGLFVASGSLLGVSAWLAPSALGHSTHLQLGLGQCTFFTMTGRPCPMCGATTTFALMADGRWISGLMNQPFAALLFWMTMGICGIGLVEMVAPTNRWMRLGRWAAPYEGPLALGFLIAMGVGWAYKIWAVG